MKLQDLSQLAVFANFMFFVGTVKASECNLVTPAEEIDWNMLPGDWFQIFNAEDPVEKPVSCFNFQDFRKSPDNAYFVLECIYSTNNTDDLQSKLATVRMIQQNFAEYKCDRKFERLFINALNGMNMDGDDKTLEKAYTEVDQVLFREVFTFHTDYENYVINLMCVDQGHYLWVHSHNPYPTTEDKRRIREKLIQIGNGWENVPLYPSGCAQLPLKV